MPKLKHTKMVVMRILEWDDQGRPSKAIIGYDDTTFDLQNDEPKEFFTALVTPEMVERHKKH